VWGKIQFIHSSFIFILTAWSQWFQLKSWGRRRGKQVRRLEGLDHLATETALIKGGILLE
jgi:hypothetical protein